MDRQSDRLIITPPNEAAWLAMRVEDVTSTESSALFDSSPYATEFELWHHKRNKEQVTIEENERMTWGTRLQDAIAQGIADDCGVKVVRVNDYMRIIEARMGSSFDFEIVGMGKSGEFHGPDLHALLLEHGPGILEIKNVDRAVFRDAWTVNEDKTIEAPGHIEIQLQHQLHVRDRGWGVIGVLVGGNAPKIIVRLRDRAVGDALEARIRAFWQSVDAGVPPQPNFAKDAEFISTLYGYAEPGKVFDGRGNEELAGLCEQYREAADREKLAKEDKNIAKAKALTIIGDSERAILDRYTITAGVVGPAHVEYDRDPYRNWRVTPKKGKA